MSIPSHEPAQELTLTASVPLDLWQEWELLCDVHGENPLTAFETLLVQAVDTLLLTVLGYEGHPDEDGTDGY